LGNCRLVWKTAFLKVAFDALDQFLEHHPSCDKSIGPASAPWLPPLLTCTGTGRAIATLLRLWPGLLALAILLNLAELLWRKWPGRRASPVE